MAAYSFKMPWARQLLAVLALLTAVPALPGVPVAEAQEQRIEDFAFARGMSSRTVRDSIRGRESVLYRFDAAAGQRLSITLRTNNPSAYFNLTYGYNGQSLHVGSINGNRARMVLPESGNYFVEVYMMRNAARRGERADYALTVGITGAPDIIVEPPPPRPPRPPQPEPVDPGYGDPDYADGLAGGPDYWRVTNVPIGDALNIRSRPAANGAVIARAPNGARLRNLGCRINGQTRWCRVELRDGSIGWAAGRFLRE